MSSGVPAKVGKAYNKLVSELKRINGDLTSFTQDVDLTYQQLEKDALSED